MVGNLQLERPVVPAIIQINIIRVYKRELLIYENQ